MSRQKGTAVVSFNFEPETASPLDARTVVQTKADLTNANTFLANDGNEYTYKGMIVSVTDDSTATNNGLYRLKALPTTTASNWQKVGSDVAIATGNSVGTVQPDDETIKITNEGVISTRPISKTLAQFTELKNNNALITGQDYLITDDNDVLDMPPGTYVPDGYAVTVATDGSGDYTDIQAALNSLVGKICSGMILIKLKSGDTFNTTTQITVPDKLSVNILSIGVTTAGTPATINSSTVRITLNIGSATGCSLIDIRDLIINGSGTDVQNSTGIMNYNLGGVTQFNRVTCSNVAWGIDCQASGHARVGNSCTMSNCTTAYMANGGILDIAGSTITNCPTAFNVYNAGLIRIQGTPTLTNVTNKYGNTVNTSTAAGLIIGPV